MNGKTCLKDFMKYSSLNVLGMLGISCYILADTFFISKKLGADGLTALNLVIPIYSLMHGCGLMIGMGGGTKYSIFKSQGNQPRANRIFTTAGILVGILAILFVCMGLFFTEPLIRILGADATVFEMGKIYLKVLLLFSPMFLLNNFLLCFVRNDGAPEFAMAAMLGGSLSNIVLDYIFMYPLGMGMFGAAVATGLAPVISILILLPVFIRRKNGFHFTKEGFSKGYAGTIFSGGLPSLITEVSSGIVIIVFNMILLQKQGNVGVAAYGIIANLSLVLVGIYTGIAQGIQPILSRNFGLEKHGKVQAILRYAMVSVVLLSGAIYVGIFIGAEQIVTIFNSENNGVLQKIAEVGLKYYFTAGMFAGGNIILAVYFTSTEYARPAHMISLLRGFIIVIPMAFLLSAIGGITGVWCVFPATELLVFIIGGTLFFRRKRYLS